MKAILDLMKRKNLTQTDLAQILGKTQPTICSMLNGGNLKPEDAKTLIKKFPKELSWEKIYGDAHV